MWCASAPMARVACGSCGRSPSKPTKTGSSSIATSTWTICASTRRRRCAVPPEPRPVQHSTVLAPSIGIGGHLAVPPLPHHRAYGSVPRRFGGLSGCHRLQGEQPHVWGRDPLHEVGGRRRAFGAGCRKASSHWYGVVVMRHPYYLPCPSTPVPGDRSGLRPTGRPTTPSADFCAAVRPPCDGLSPTAQ